MDRLVDELKLLTEIDLSILDGQGLDSILNLITEKANALFKADYCCICLLDENDYLKIKSHNKPDRLSIEEMEIMKQHAILGANIIRPIEFLNL